MTRAFSVFALLTCFAAAIYAPSAAAQAYPDKPVRLVIPYNPGGVVDYIGRVLAQHLNKPLGQPVVAENRPGAGGIVGTDTVARSAPDGYSLVIMDPAIVINPTLQPSMPYDLFKDLEPVSIVSSSPLVLVVTPGLPVKTFADLISYAKANPGKLNFSSAGIGTTPHLSGELFKQRTNTEATHIPYKGIALSYTDLMSGKIQFSFSSIAGAVPFTSDKRVTAIATTGAKRTTTVYPDLPTVSESGLPGFEVDLWLGIFAPKGIPAAVKAKLASAIAETLKEPEIKAAFAKVGAEPLGSTPDEANSTIKSEFEKWKRVIADGNIKSGE